MRPRASQVARIRFVETEEDVETCIRLLHGSVSGIMVHWPDTPHLVRGVGGVTGGGSIFYLPQAKLFIFRHLHIKGEVGEVKTGVIFLYVRQFRS